MSCASIKGTLIEKGTEVACQVEHGAYKGENADIDGVLQEPSPYAGEMLEDCRTVDYVKIKGATFDKNHMEALRAGMDSYLPDSVVLCAESGKSGTIGIKADALFSIGHSGLTTLLGSCPTDLKGNDAQCAALKASVDPILEKLSSQEPEDGWSLLAVGGGLLSTLGELTLLIAAFGPRGIKESAEAIGKAYGAIKDKLTGKDKGPKDPPGTGGNSGGGKGTEAPEVSAQEASHLLRSYSGAARVYVSLEDSLSAETSPNANQNSGAGVGVTVAPALAPSLKPVFVPRPALVPGL